jgi:alkylation response protein AidB-like acyl-CoA dehydrogenase
MDFRFAPEEEAFRKEVRTFLAEELPGDYEPMTGEAYTQDQWDFATDFSKRLARRGWICGAWPKEYGGAGFSIMQQVVFNEEMAYRGAPMVNGPGMGMVGPMLIVHGSEEQKREHLPYITSVQRIWCQGYSEPGAGSDLASLQTRATRDGDDFVINGQKIWTTQAHRADWMVILTRTDPEAPKHRGISMFLLDMKTPGITVSPLYNMAGEHSFNQVFFDSVRVPAANMVGEENRGWYTGMTLLDFERSNIAGAAGGQRELERFVQFCRAHRGPTGQLLIDMPGVKLKLVNHAIEIEVGRCISYRVASIQARGQVPNTEASVSKLYFSEMGQRWAQTGINIMGLYGNVRPESSQRSWMKGRYTMSYMNTVPATIAAGSSEVQRNIIATRGLGLPRD